MLNLLLQWMETQGLYLVFHYSGIDSIAISTADNGEEFEYNISERKNIYSTIHCTRFCASRYTINSDIEAFLPDMQTTHIVYGEKFHAMENSIQQLCTSSKLTIIDNYTGNVACEIEVPTFSESDIGDALDTIAEMFV